MTREANMSWWVCIIATVYALIVGNLDAAITLCAASLVIWGCGRKP